MHGANDDDPGAGFCATPIGVIRTEDLDVRDVAIQTRMAPQRRGAVEVYLDLADGLDGLAGFDFAWVVTALDRAEDPRNAGGEALRPVPFLLAEYGTRVGVFASRFPQRPNRLGLSLVRVERVEATTVHFSGVDMLDGTPVLDIKPWVAEFDLPTGASPPSGVRCGWYDTLETRPLTLDEPHALLVQQRDLLGHSAVVVRTVRLDGLGATDAGEIALIDDTGVRAGRILSGALDDALTALAARGSGAADRDGSRLLELVVDDASARRCGLTCGGRASVVVQPVDQVPGVWWDALAARRPIALTTNLDTPHVGSVAVELDGPPGPVADDVVSRARELVACGRTASDFVETAAGRVLVEATVPAPRLVVVGDAAVAGGIVHLAAWLGWSAEQFATAADAAAAVATLGDRDALVVLDHGITATGPLLAVALAAGVGYVGALGSRATQARRAEHLRALGAPADAVARLHGPTGLDLGASSRAETALSICAEITASRTGRSARPLRDSSGPIQA